MSELGSRQVLSTRALAGVLLADAVYNVVPNEYLAGDFERLGLPGDARYLTGTAKLAAAVALLRRERSPGLARLAAAMLVFYFCLAVGAHARVRDEPWRYGAAAGMLGWSVLTVRRLRPSPGD